MILTLLSCCLFLQGITSEVIEHAQAGAAAQKAGKLDVAIAEFRKVVELQPGVASGHANLGEAYFQNGDYGAAVPELQRALELNPNMMGTHQTLGVALLVQGNAEAAIPHLEKNHTPELLGAAYLETGRLGSAIMALQEALARQPNDADMLYYFGRATNLAAKRSLDRLEKINPQLARDGPHADVSHAEQSVVDLQKALAVQPNDPKLLLEFSRAAAQASIEARERLLKSDANSARAHQLLAEGEAASGRLPQAEKEYAEALRLKPYTASVHLELGNLMIAERNWAGAAAEFAMEAKLRPANADAPYRLGSVLLQQGMASQAVEELAKADRLRPDSPPILQELGRAAFAANDTARAEAAWVKLLGIDSTSDLAASAHFGLATLYRRAGRSQSADREIAAYQQLKDKKGGH